jgi:hypothetical protein
MQGSFDNVAPCLYENSAYRGVFCMALSPPNRDGNQKRPFQTGIFACHPHRFPRGSELYILKCESCTREVVHELSLVWQASLDQWIATFPNAF